MTEGVSVMKQIWIFIFTGPLLFKLCESASYEGILKKNDIPISHAYLIGSKWAIAADNPLKGLNKDDLSLIVENEKFEIEKLIPGNQLTAYRNVSVNFAALKLTRTASVHGAAMLSQFYPQEGVWLYSSPEKNQMGYVSKYRTTTYKLCEQQFGYRFGVFCIINFEGRTLHPGIGVFNNDILYGLTTGVKIKDIHLVTAIAPAFEWITDTMSEIIYR